MDTWRMRGWEYRLWTEAEIDALTLENRRHYDYYYRRAIWHGASDIARIEILQRFGGVYIDADTERTDSLEGAPFLAADFFSVEANKARGVPQGVTRVANGVVGTIPDHPIIRAYIAEIGRLPANSGALEPAWKTIGGTLFTRLIGEHRTPATMILEPHTFYPFDSSGNPSRTSGKSYARHLWGSTHGLYGRDKM